MNTMTNKYMNIVYRNWKLAMESINDTVYGIVINQINKYRGQTYFPFIYTLFILFFIFIYYKYYFLYTIEILVLYEIYYYIT